MTENKNVENERYLYGYAHIYTPYTFGKPKLHEMGYFTDNIESFYNLNDLSLYYVYGELIDYNEDCKGQYFIDYDDDDYEGRYRCGYEDDTDIWCGSDFYESNFAFYIPENSIPQEKRELYRSHASNVR